MMSRLGSREKWVLGIGAAIVGLILVHALVVTPAINSRRSRQEALQAQKNNLVAIADLAARYEGAKASASGNWEKFLKKKDFSLEKFLDQLAGQARVKKNVKYIKPNKKPIANSSFVRSIVDMKLDGLTMEQLLDFLFKIENSDNFLSVQRITVNGSGKPEDYSVSAVLQVTTIENEKQP